MSKSNAEIFIDHLRAACGEESRILQDAAGWHMPASAARSSRGLVVASRLPRPSGLVSRVLPCLWLVAFAALAHGGLTFSVAGGEASVTGYSGTIPSALYIPATYTVGASTYPVTRIASYALYSAHGLTSVTIPNSVTSIGGSSFVFCSDLRELIIPNSVTNIGADAFSNCQVLRSLTLSENLVSIGERVFTNCAYLTSLAIPKRVVTIGAWAFSDCVGLTGITIPASVTSIGEGAFARCRALTSISVDGANPAYSGLSGVLFDKTQTTLVGLPGGWAGEYVVPAGVTSIGVYAFSSVSGLTRVSIPASVSHIGNFVFSSCPLLAVIEVDGANASYASVGGVLFDKARTTLILCPGGMQGQYEIPASVTSLAPAAFDHCAWLTAVTIPNGVTRIPNGIFLFCERLTAMRIPNSVTSIGSNAFYACTGLLSVKIPYSVTTIEGHAFHFCRNLRSVTLPANVTGIGDYAFSNCSSLGNILFTGNAPVMGTSVFALIGSGLTISFQSGGSGFTIPTWQGVPTVIADPSQLPAVATVSSALPDSTSNVTLTGTVNPNGLPTTAVFEYGPTTNYGNAQAVALSPNNGSGVQTVAADLYGLPKGVSYHFRLTATNANGTATGEDLTFATERSSGDFLYTTSGTTVALTGYTGPGGKLSIPAELNGLPVTRIGSGAFSSINNLTAVTIPASVTAIGDFAFYSCLNLSGVTIPSSVTRIECYVFYLCTGLKAIEVDAANPTYSTVDGVLFNKAMTTLIQYPGGKEGAYTIPGSVTFIEVAAFSDCGGLTSVTIPPNVTEMGLQAFYRCSSLSHLSLPESLTRISDAAFYGCSSLTSVTLPDGVISIGQMTFYRCAGLTNMVIPASVTSIGSGCFYECRNLVAMLFDGNAPTADGSPFESTAPGFTVYYHSGRTGFATPLWQGYPTVVLGDPGIWIQPRSSTILTGTTAMITVFAVGTGPLGYQWYQGLPDTTTTPVGTDSPSFTTPALTADAHYWVKVTNGANPAGADSIAAAVTVASPFGPWIRSFATIPDDERSATSDPDRDGIPNAVEFVIGGRPDGSSVDHALLPQTTGYPTVVPDGDPFYLYLTFSHRRSLAAVAAGVTSDFEFSNGLTGDWINGSDTPGLIVDVTPGPTGPDGYDTVIYYYPLSFYPNRAIFARLKVVVP